MPHVSRKMLAGPYARRKRARSDTARSAMKHGTVRSVAAAEVPAFHAALKSLALADSGNIHKLADLEAIHQYAVAGLGFVLRIFNAKFAKVSQWSNASLFEMAGQCLVHTLRLDEFHQSQLHRVVSVFVFGPSLNHHARTGLEDSARNRGAVFGKDLGHPQVYSQYSVDGHFARSFLCVLFRARSLPPCSRPKALISTSTPGGKSSFISASTVSGVG